MYLPVGSRDVLKRYGVAVALPVFAVALRSVLPFPEGAGIYQLPLAAVVLSAWYGGRGPGLLASVISIIGAMYLLPPAGSFAVHADHALPLSIFAMLCLLLTEFGAGRRRAEQALRESEARFRKLTDLSVDGYWKQDENLRFIYSMDERHGFENRSLGKTRWELPFTPLSASWGEHRAVLTARKPFRGFEYTRVHPDGTTRYISVSGVPAFDDQGAFKGYDGVASDITPRKLAESERQAHVWFLESLDRINRAMQGTQDIERMLNAALMEVLEIFRCDRALVSVNGIRGGTSWYRRLAIRVRSGVEHPDKVGVEYIADPDSHAMRMEVRAAGRPVQFVLGSVPDHVARVHARYGARSVLSMPIEPKHARLDEDHFYYFTVDECSVARAWTADEIRLFEEIGHRLADALSGLIAYRNLQESERRLEGAQSLAHVGWWERDYATGRVSLSDEAGRIFGVQPVDLPHWDGRWRSLIHPEDRDKAAAASEMALAGGSRYDVEYRVVRPDSTVRVVHSQGDVTRDDAGRPLRQFGVLQDITELRQTERRLEAAQHLARVGWWERDYVAARMMLSDEIAEIYGIADRDRTIDLAEWMKLLPAIIHPVDYPRAFAASEAALRGGPRYDIEYRVVHRDGTVRIVRSQADVTRDESGRVVRQFGVAQDITQLRKAEQEVRARQEMLELAQKAARAVAFDWHIGARESENRWSPELEAMYGLERGSFDRTFQGWKKLVHPEDWPSVKLALERASASGDIDHEYRVVHKDGAVHWLHAKGRMFFNAEGQPERMVGFMIDVTVRRQAEEELRAKDDALQVARAELARVSRVTTLGELTASIAHEVNQPLGAMVANAGACSRWLAAEPPETARARRALESIAADGRRASEIIGRIRSLVKRQAPRRDLVDVNVKVMEVIGLAADEIRRNHIALRRELAQGLPRVEGDGVQLQQVLLNLFLNAIEAMSPIRDRARELTIASRPDGADTVLVEVRDTGPGLDPERAAQVFEPFYTTKPEGLGIGLSISRSIVEAHGGQLSVNPNQPHGASFRFSLPVGGTAP